MNEVKVGDIRIGKGNPLVLIAGPCVIEGEAVVLEIAKQLKTLCKDLKIPLIFKASYEKDNRGSEKSYNGPGLKEGLKILHILSPQNKGRGNALLLRYKGSTVLSIKILRNHRTNL